MARRSTRREFIGTGMAVSAGLSSMGRIGSLMGLGSERGYLARPDFYWGVGLENCWIAQADPRYDGDRRLLDVFLQMQHYDKWKEDLDLAAEVGVNCIRYSVPWYKAEPKPGVYDWSWIEKPIDYLVNELKIVPIIDLIHYGTPDWMPHGVIDERFPEALASYASAMADHFKGAVDHYTPHNEPQITALFCGLIGRWPPYQSSVASFCQIGAHVAKAMILESRALREALPNGVLMSADAVAANFIADHFPSGRPGVLEQGNLQVLSAAFPSSLAYGLVEPGDPLAAFLVDHGVAEKDIEWCFENAEPPDVLGLNYYPEITQFGGLNQDFTQSGRVPLEKAARQAAGYAARNVRQVQSLFGLPACITETSAGLSHEARIAYMNALYEEVQSMRETDFPFVGIIWWPLFQTIQWDYREGIHKPLQEFIVAGGWNNALWDIDAQPDGDLRRIKTPAAAAYREIIRKDLARFR